VTASNDEPGTSLAPGRVVPAPDAVWRNHRDQFFHKEARSTTRNMVCGGLVVEAALIAILIEAHYPMWRILAALGCISPSSPDIAWCSASPATPSASSTRSSA